MFSLTTTLSPNAPHSLLSSGKSLSLQFPGSCEISDRVPRLCFTLCRSISGLRVGSGSPQKRSFMYSYCSLQNVCHEDYLVRLSRFPPVPWGAPIIKRWILNSQFKDGFGVHHAFVSNSKLFYTTLLFKDNNFVHPSVLGGLLRFKNNYTFKVKFVSFYVKKNTSNWRHNQWSEFHAGQSVCFCVCFYNSLMSFP